MTIMRYSQWGYDLDGIGNEKSKRVVIFGSSVAGGGIASDYAHSWAGLLTASLETKGFTVENLSVGGTQTDWAVSNFMSMVAPKRPGYVIIAFSLWNDTSFEGDPLNRVYHYIENLDKLNHYCNLIGAKMIVGGVYPKYLESTPQSRAHVIAFSFYRLIASRRYRVINWYSQLSHGYPDISGAWFQYYVDVDGIHPNDLGHAEMYACIDQSMFYSDYDHKIIDRIPFSMNYDSADTTANIPLQCFPSTPMKSWSVFAWVKNAALTIGGNVIALNFNMGAPYDDLRIRTGGGVYNVAGGAPISVVIPSAITINNTNWQHVGLTYHHGRHEICFWINGALIGRLADSRNDFSNPIGFCFMARPGLVGYVNNNITGWKLFQPVVYRNALESGAVAALLRGKVPDAGLDFYCPFYEDKMGASTTFAPVPVANYGSSQGKIELGCKLNPDSDKPY